MPTTRQVSGAVPGRDALLALAEAEDKTEFYRALISAAVLKEDLKVKETDTSNAAPGTTSLPSNREVMFTRDGGVAVRMRATENLERGDVVTATDGQDYVSCRKHVANDKEPPVGVIHESVVSGDLATVVVSGMARVKIYDPPE